MTDPRTPSFEAIRAICPPGVFNEPGNRLALHNLLDAFGAKREGGIVVGGRATHKLADPAAFFVAVRKITDEVDQEQVDVINAMLEAAAHWRLSWLAYGLATAWHECELRPIHERGGRAYLDKYDTGRLAARLGNTPDDDDDGILYAGRGLVQLTGRRNYREAGKFLGLDLLGQPDLALDRGHATRILVWGMETGTFTTKALRDYLHNDIGTHDEFVSARRIINGTDKAHTIAGYAERFQAALKAGGWA